MKPQPKVRCASVTIGVNDFTLTYVGSELRLLSVNGWSWDADYAKNAMATAKVCGCGNCTCCDILAAVKATS